MVLVVALRWGEQVGHVLAAAAMAAADGGGDDVADGGRPAVSGGGGEGGGSGEERTTDLFRYCISRRPWMEHQLAIMVPFDNNKTNSIIGSA